tara:strand:+ start:58 stop:531 length:474 start_codon:yes stop_codon:yes gene_type:complete
MTKEIYQKSVDILLDSYNAGTLFHGKCSACAVGNLVAANNDIELVKSINKWTESPTAKWSEGVPLWNGVFATDSGGQAVFMYAYEGSTKTEIDSTGIPLTELMAIEKAFESAADEEENNGQYKGLCAVLDVMKDMVSEEVAHMDNVERLETIYATIK